MRGYPKNIAAKQDYENLLEMGEYREQALADLNALLEIEDEFITTATELIDKNNLDSEWKTKKIVNPSPIHKIKGFQNKAEIRQILLKYIKKKEEK